MACGAACTGCSRRCALTQGGPIKDNFCVELIPRESGLQRNAARPAMGRSPPRLTVYGRQGRKSSFNVQKVMWLGSELGIVHTHVELGGSHGGLGTAEFRAMNPHGRVPVVDDNGTIIWESHAILRYLAACYGRGRFWSDD